MKNIIQTAVAQIQPLLNRKQVNQWTQQVIAFAKANWFRLIVIYFLFTISITLNDISRSTGYTDNRDVVSQLQDVGYDIVEQLKYIDKNLDYANQELDSINSTIRYK